MTALRPSRDGWLADLDGIASEPPRESDEVQRELRDRALWLTVLALILLVVGEVAVFHPLVRRVDDAMVQIERARADLRAIRDSTVEGIVVTDVRE